MSSDNVVHLPQQAERHPHGGIRRGQPNLTRRIDLLNWLGEQLKRSGPQAQVLIGIIHVFDDLLAFFNNSRRFDPDHYDWSAYLDEVFRKINRSSDHRSCSTNVLSFLVMIYGDSIASGEPVSLVRAIEVLTELLDRDQDYLRHKRLGGRVYLVSTRLFEETYGMSVRVKLGSETGQPRDSAAVLSGSFEI